MARRSGRDDVLSGARHRPPDAKVRLYVDDGKTGHGPGLELNLTRGHNEVSIKCDLGETKAPGSDYETLKDSARFLTVSNSATAVNRTLSWGRGPHSDFELHCT